MTAMAERAVALLPECTATILQQRKEYSSDGEAVICATMHDGRRGGWAMLEEEGELRVHLILEPATVIAYMITLILSQPIVGQEHLVESPP